MDIKRVKSNLISKVCWYCDRRFQAERDSARYCSSSCRTNAWKERQKPKIGRPKGSYDKQPRKRRLKPFESSGKIEPEIVAPEKRIEVVPEPEVNHEPVAVEPKPDQSVKQEVKEELVYRHPDQYRTLDQVVERHLEYGKKKLRAVYVRNRYHRQTPDEVNTGKFLLKKIDSDWYLIKKL